MRVAVVAEYYPRPSHPGLGIWAHRQARAVADLGVDVRVLALERPLPPLAALRSLVPGGEGFDARPLREWAAALRKPARDTTIDGVEVQYVRFVSPPRPLSYASWGRWAAGPLARRLDALHRGWPFDVVHAHYAVPAADAALRWMGRHEGPNKRGSERHNQRLPLVVSVHGGDLSYTAPRSRHGRRVVSQAFRSADALIANSELTRAGIEALVGARPRLEVIHPGADLLHGVVERHADPTVVTVAHLEQHKSQADVIRALAALRTRHPRLRYVLVGGGPDRARLEQLAGALGVAGHVRFTGALSHPDAIAELARCHLHAMPSRHDAFGVAHLEAMAAGVPTIGAIGTGAEDIARAGDGIVLVPAADVAALAEAIDRLISDDARRADLGQAGRRTVGESFSWERCGRATLALYDALAGAH
jgi:glycosyltransferase involved in cell wall biosynthesis